MATSSDRSFRRLAAASAVISAPIAYVGEYFGFTAIDFDPTVFSDPSALIALGTEGAALFWWGWRLDLFGYYLLVAPAAIYLWYWLRPKNPALVSLLTVCGLTYVLLGAVGAAINIAIWPRLMTEYAQAAPEQQAVLETVFGTYATFVAVGVWGILNRLVSAVWWLGIGFLLRSERRWLGRFTIALGVFAAMTAFGNLAVIVPLVGVGTMGYLFLAPVWALWLGVDLWRRPDTSFEVEPTRFTLTGSETAG